ncbi:DOT1-domain-containing protein [Clavulina sp. PMI_390]|nr:DOT1-domain-containing protein [Clavulina sp. PMI_390]
MSPAFINNSIPSPTPEPHSDPLLRTLEKAHNTRNGPLFVKTVEAISEYFRSMKLEMRSNAEAWYNAPSPSPASTPNGKGKGKDRSDDERAPSIVVTPEKSNDGYQGAGISGGVPPKLWRAITEEVYQRAVGPDIEDTKKYRSFSSETYGELNAIFISDLIHRFGLGPGRTFVDLGSGVGNCVIQAALQAGCDSYGIELNAPVAALSFTQQREFHARLRMWGLTAGSVTLLEGDFTESPEVCEWIRKADVVLVNNYIFSADLNEKLTWRFLDLRDGAKVVVLKPFWPLNRPLTERTAYTPEAVLSSGVQRMEYIKDSVSWTQEPGEFYIYTKSEGRAVIPFESGRSSSRRGGRQFS